MAIAVSAGLCGPALAASLGQPGPAAQQPDQSPAAPPTPATPAPPVLPASPAGPTLTLEQVVAAALTRNPQITSAQEALTAAQQNITVARTGLAPTVSATGTGSAGTTSGLFTATGVPVSGSGSLGTTGSASLTASWPIYDSGRTRVAVESAQAAVASAEAALRQARQDIALQAATAFFGVLKAERLETVQEQQLTQVQAQLALSEAQVRAGVAAQSDVIQVQAQVAQAQVNLLSAQSQIAAAKAALQNVIGGDATAPVEVAEPAAPPVQVAVTGAQAMQAALGNRPEIAKAQAAVQSSQASLDQAYVAAGPQVDVAASGGYTPFSTNANAVNSTAYGVTATIQLPLYDAGKGRAGIAAAQATLRSSQAQLQSATLSVQQDVTQAYLAAVQAAANLTATTAARAAADQALSVADGRYRAGVGTILEVLTARTTAAQADVNATSALYDYQTALATLRHAEGLAILPVTASAPGGTP
jgi:outer membrane protein